MIKVKLLNFKKGRNMDTFEPLFPLYHKLRSDYGIELLYHDEEHDIIPYGERKKAETSDYDYIIVGPSDFVDKNKPLQESVDWGLENLYKITEGGDYFLWDGFDSTSLFGSYEVFEQSDAVYLLKNQLLNNKQDYNKPYIAGKWFFGIDDNLGKSYDIPQDKWDKIKLSGINLGYTYMAKFYQWNDVYPQYHVYEGHQHRFLPSNLNKNIDVTVLCLSEISAGYEHGVRNDLLYMKHRKDFSDIVNKLNYNVTTGYLERIEYLNNLYNSKIILSPFGQGEICYRDIEAIQFGALMIKPDMSMINTSPNIYNDGETYIACKYDGSDLEEKIQKVLGNFEKYSYIVNNFRNKFREQYNSDKLCLHWYEMFKNLKNVEVSDE